MHGGKGAYLKKLTAVRPMPSVRIGKTFEGTSPPSVFVGSWNYPKVFAGPMICPSHGDTRIMDTPESWIPGELSQDEIIGYRMSLVRGKRRMDVRDLSGRFAEQLRDIALSSASLESEVVFSKPPEPSPESLKAAEEQKQEHMRLLAMLNQIKRRFRSVYTVPYSTAVYEAQKRGMPLSHVAPDSSAGIAYKTIAEEVMRWN